MKPNIEKLREEFREFFCDCIDAKPRDFDFSEGLDYDGEEKPGTWAIVYPDLDDWTAEELASVLEDHNGAGCIDEDEDPRAFQCVTCGRMNWTEGEPCPEAEEPGDLHVADTDEQQEREEKLRERLAEYYQENPEEAGLVPMMNYAYPLADYKSRSSSELASLCERSGAGCLCVVEIEGEPFLALTGGGMDLSWEICRAYLALGFLPPLHFGRDLPRYGGADEDQRTLRACYYSAEIARGWAEQASERIAERIKE